MENMYFKKLNPDLTSPYQGYQWELGKEVEIGNFDTGSRDCSTRLYYLKLDQLLFCPAKPIFEVKVGGQIKEFEDKSGCSKMTVLREVPKEEILELVRNAGLDQTLGFKYSESLFPINPFEIDPPPITEEIIAKLRQWIQVHNTTLCYAAGKKYSAVDLSVWESLGESIHNLVLDALHNVGVNIDFYVTEVDNSVTDIIEAYVKVGLLLYKYKLCSIECGTDLWYQGLIPSYDGTTWRLHGGPKAEVLFEMEEKVQNG